MRILDFEKTADGKWYIVLPDWEGDKSDLEMVLGADMMLDIYAQGAKSVSLSVSETEVPGYDKIILMQICSSVTGGAYYKIKKINDIDYDFRIWICDVMKTIFGQFPQVFFLKDCTL